MSSLAVLSSFFIFLQCVQGTVFPPVSNPPPIPGQALRTLDISGPQFYVQDDLQGSSPQTTIKSDGFYSQPDEPKPDDQWFVTERQSTSGDSLTSAEEFERLYANGMPAIGPVATPPPDDSYVAQPSVTSKITPDASANSGSSIWVLTKGPNNQLIPERWVQMQIPDERVVEVVSQDTSSKDVSQSFKSASPTPFAVKSQGSIIQPGNTVQQVWVRAPSPNLPQNIFPNAISVVEDASPIKQMLNTNQPNIKQVSQPQIIKETNFPPPSDSVITKKSTGFIVPPPPPPPLKSDAVNSKQAVVFDPPVTAVGDITGLNKGRSPIIQQMKHIWIPTSQQTGKFVTVPVSNPENVGIPMLSKGYPMDPVSVSDTWILKQDGPLPRFELQKSGSPTQVTDKRTISIGEIPVTQFDSPKNAPLVGKSVDMAIPTDIWPIRKDVGNGNFGIGPSQFPQLKSKSDYTTVGKSYVSPISDSIAVGKSSGSLSPVTDSVFIGKSMPPPPPVVDSFVIGKSSSLRSPVSGSITSGKSFTPIISDSIIVNKSPLPALTVTPVSPVTGKSIQISSPLPSKVYSGKLVQQPSPKQPPVKSVVTDKPPCPLPPQRLPLIPKSFPLSGYRQMSPFIGQPLTRIIRINRYPYGSYYILNPNMRSNLYAYPRQPVLIQRSNNGLVRLVPPSQMTVPLPGRQVAIPMPPKQVTVPVTINKLSPRILYPPVQVVNRIRYTLPWSSYLGELPAPRSNNGKVTNKKKSQPEPNSSISSSSESSSFERKAPPKKKERQRESENKKEPEMKRESESDIESEESAESIATSESDEPILKSENQFELDEPTATEMSNESDGETVLSETETDESIEAAESQFISRPDSRSFSNNREVFKYLGKPYLYGYDHRDMSEEMQRKNEMIDAEGRYAGGLKYRDQNGVYHNVAYITNSGPPRSTSSVAEVGTNNYNNANNFIESPTTENSAKGKVSETITHSPLRDNITFDLLRD